MDPREKIQKVGQVVYGNRWKSPLSREMKVDLKTLRRFLSGERYFPKNLSAMLLQSMEQELAKIYAAIEIINSDKLQRESITSDLIVTIAKQYDYACQEDYQSAVEAMKNAVLDETYLSDLAAIAQRFSKNYY
ncbi:hypothetical protein [Klebsiella oxytoca]|uniref:hypothetical protein n=1 Tax=Klebsiella oxytoca TaxID=571 RepID=UPI001CCC5798|nr:hypothetical protein [Klebsiella oxytoca]MBZ7304680.1 hypothetical protein [Klebsiella oxytoca]